MDHKTAPKLYPDDPWNPSWPILAHVGSSWALLEHFWGILWLSWALLGSLEALLGPFWGVLRPKRDLRWSKIAQVRPKIT